MNSNCDIANQIDDSTLNDMKYHSKLIWMTF